MTTNSHNTYRWQFFTPCENDRKSEESLGRRHANANHTMNMNLNIYEFDECKSVFCTFKTRAITSWTTSSSLFFQSPHFGTAPRSCITAKPNMKNENSKNLSHWSNWFGCLTNRLIFKNENRWQIEWCRTWCISKTQNGEAICGEVEKHCIVELTTTGWLCFRYCKKKVSI